MSTGSQSNQEPSDNFKSVVSALDGSLVETVLKYAEVGNREAMGSYMSAMTQAGVHRMAEIMGLLYDTVMEQAAARNSGLTVETSEDGKNFYIKEGG